jgi:hypothetical protein
MTACANTNCTRTIEWVPPEPGDGHGFWRHTEPDAAFSLLFCWPGRGIDGPRAEPAPGARHTPPASVASVAPAAEVPALDQALEDAGRLSELADSASIRAAAIFLGRDAMIAAYRSAAKTAIAAGAAWSLAAEIAEDQSPETHSCRSWSELASRSENRKG